MADRVDILYIRKALRQELEPVLNQLESMTKILTSLDKRAGQLEKDVKFLKKASKYLRATANLLVENFEEGDQNVLKRVERIEDTLLLSRIA